MLSCLASRSSNLTHWDAIGTFLVASKIYKIGGNDEGYIAYPTRVKFTMSGSVKQGDLKKLQLQLIMDAVASFDENKANTYTEK